MNNFFSRNNIGSFVSKTFINRCNTGLIPLPDSKVNEYDYIKLKGIFNMKNHDIFYNSTCQEWGFQRVTPT